MDAKWWNTYREEVKTFRGERFSCSVASNGVIRMAKPFMHFGNSGAAAVSLAYIFAAKRIVLLGYDCQRTGGQSHWHGDHPKGLGNAGGIPNWPRQFGRVAEYVRVPVINCSRATALTCFPRGELEKELAEQA